MTIYNFWRKSNKVQQIVIPLEQYNELQKSDLQLKTIANYSRPQDLGGLTPNMTLASFSDMVSPIDLYQMGKYSDILRNVIPTIRNEIFRNGFDVKGEVTELSNYQKKKVDNIIKRANHNEQTLKEVLMECEDDLQIYDNAYLLAIKCYKINKNKDIIGGSIDELVRIDPLVVEKVLDRKARLGYDLQGRKVYFSIKNRNELLYTETDKEGYQTLPAHYKVRTGDSEGDFAYYDSNEIIHSMKYNPSKTYGFSQLYSLYNKVMTLINQDYYIKQYYSGSKVPKGLLTVNTSNSEGFMTMWSKFLDKIRNNPHVIHPVVNQTNDPGKNAFQFINFMNNLAEMQYTEVRNEMRQQIGALFNVSPVFQNDVSTSGGLNNEGLQITVTNRGVELGQSIYNEKILPWIFERNMGIFDFKVTLKPSDEIDEVAEKDLRLKELQIAKATAELGIKVKMEKDGSFTYKEGKVILQQTQEPFIPFTKSGPIVVSKSEPIITTKSEPIVVSKKDLSAKDKKIFQTALEKELDEIVNKLDFTKKPSESELNILIEKITKNLNKRLNIKSANLIRVVYDKSKNVVEKELKQTFPYTDTDKNVIEELKRDPTYRKAFEGISKDMSKQLTKIIKEAYKKPDQFTIDNIVKLMKQELGNTEENLRTIARTETSKVSIAARKNQYDKTGFEYKYKWIGPDDNRTGKDSREIKKRTKNGVTWDELVKIIKDVAGPNWKVDTFAPIPRPNTRHTFIAERIKNGN